MTGTLTNDTNRALAVLNIILSETYPSAYQQWDTQGAEAVVSGPSDSSTIPPGVIVPWTVTGPTDTAGSTVTPTVEITGFSPGNTGGVPTSGGTLPLSDACRAAAQY